LAVLTATLAMLTGGAPASADGYPAVWYPDKGTYHSFCFSLAFAQHSGLVSRARYSMDNNDGVEAQTVVNTLEQSCQSATDVVFRLRDLGGAVGGATGCLRFNANGYCDSWSVDIDWEAIKQHATNDGYQARKTLCHEIGHTLGLQHYAAGASPDGAVNSCMISGVWDSGAAWTRTYGDHHRRHIDSWFA
jgi:hypothetical protein